MEVGLQSIAIIGLYSFFIEFIAWDIWRSRNLNKNLYILYKVHILAVAHGHGKQLTFMCIGNLAKTRSESLVFWK